jgi:chemotaxis protein CheD
MTEAPAAARAAPVPTHYLYPGELVATSESRVISTVLGSCVAACLWDGTTHSGGLNHFLLPHEAGAGGSSGRFARSAMEALLAHMLALGCEARNLTARLVGGASQFEGRADRASIGEQNVGVATRFLEEAGIPVVRRDVGGARGRRLVFDVGSGDVWVRTL